METWKDIEGFNGVYQISQKGRVKTIERVETVIDSRGRRFTRKRKGKILSNCRRKDGYAKVSLCKGGIVKQENVHRLVAYHFIHNPDNKPEVNHIDGNKHNPHVDNLEWVTASENGKHAYREGLSISAKRYGKDNHRSRKVKQISKDGGIKIWDSMMDAEREGYSASGICRCCMGENNTHKKSRWEYIN